MKEEILNLIGNKKMTSDEITLYFDLSGREIINILDEMVEDNILIYENGKYSKNNYLINKEYILFLIKKNRFIDINHLVKEAHSKKEVVEEILKELINEKLIYSKNNKIFYYIFIGTIKEKKEYYEIIDEETKNTYFFDDNAFIFNGDTVSYVLLNSMKSKIVEVIKRNKTSIIGRISIKDKYNKKFDRKYKSIVFHSFDKYINRDLILKEDVLDGALNDDVVALEIEYNNEIREIKPVKVLKIISKIDDNYLDIYAKIYEYNFDIEFNNVDDDLKEIPDIVSEDEIKGRTDFRLKSVITIDNDDSKDFDDAVGLEKDGDNYILYVHIADVANYVKEGSNLDKEALRRGTSLYLADKVIPMLPFKLSNGICSLNPDVDRLTLSIIMNINKNGDVIKYEIVEGVIKSLHQMKYSEVNKIFSGNNQEIEKYKDVYQMLLDMKELSNILRKKREERGALDFEENEYYFVMNDGVPIDIIKHERGIAEKMIEDFMLIANETIAYNASIMGLPIVYRIHEEPDNDKIKDFINTINGMGYKIKKLRNGTHAKELQKVLNNLKDEANYDIISNMLLRSMMKAKYYEENSGHYGLQLKNYCHFTSPIRRYPDLMTHRVIKNLMIHPNNMAQDLKRYQSIIPDVAFKNSNSERRAVDLERKVDDILYAKYYESKLNKIFKGKISSITNFGFFVKLENGAEGLIAFRDINGFVEVNAEHTKAGFYNNVYTLGDVVDVMVIEVNKHEGLIKLEFA